MPHLKERQSNIIAPKWIHCPIAPVACQSALKEATNLVGPKKQVSSDCNSKLSLLDDLIIPPDTFELLWCCCPARRCTIKKKERNAVQGIIFSPWDFQVVSILKAELSWYLMENWLRGWPMHLQLSYNLSLPELHTLSFSMNSACWRQFCWQTLYSTQLTHPMNQCKTLGVAIGNQVQYNAELAIFWYWMHRSVQHCPMQLVITNIIGCNAALLLVRE